MTTIADTMISLSLTELATVSGVVIALASPIVVLLWQIQIKVSRLCDRLGTMHEKIDEQCERLERVERIVFTPNPGLKGAHA